MFDSTFQVVVYSFSREKKNEKELFISRLDPLLFLNFRPVTVLRVEPEHCSLQGLRPAPVFVPGSFRKTVSKAKLCEKSFSFDTFLCSQRKVCMPNVCLIQFRSSVPEHVDGGADALDYREIQLTGDGSFAALGAGQVLAPGVEDGAVTAAGGI